MSYRMAYHVSRGMRALLRCESAEISRTRARALRRGGVVNVARRALDSRIVAESIGCLVKFRPPRVASPFAGAFKFIVKDVPSHRTCRRGYLGTRAGRTRYRSQCRKLRTRIQWMSLWSLIQWFQ